MYFVLSDFKRIKYQHRSQTIRFDLLVPASSSVQKSFQQKLLFWINGTWQKAANNMVLLIKVTVPVQVLSDDYLVLYYTTAVLGSFL